MEQHTPTSPRILLVVADVDLRRRCEAGLRSAGFTVSSPGDAAAVAVLVDSFRPDVTVVDDRVRDDAGRPLHETISRLDDGYVVGIDTSGLDRNRVDMLRSGADDAVSVPVDPDEVAVRCHTVLRRPREISGDRHATRSTTITLGPLSIDSGRHEIRLGDIEVSATRIEFSLLEHLCRRPTEVASRTELLQAVWGPHWVGDTHVVDVHLSNLRRKLDRAAPDLRVVHTVRGIGFRISNEVLDAAGTGIRTGIPAALRTPAVPSLETIDA